MIERLRARGIGYWLTAAVILAVTVLARPVLDERLNLKDLRNTLFVLLTQSPTNPAVPHEVKLVRIGDDAFWGPALQHRSPTNRTYLAQLVAAADAADASVIALDFDLRLPAATATVRPGDFAAIEPAYRAETDALVRAIGAAAARRRIVLARSLAGPVDGPFRLAADSWQAYGICLRPLPGGAWANPGAPGFPLSAAAQANIRCGYIALMDDARRVPPPARLVDSPQHVDAFSMALARARDPQAPARVGEGEDTFASYIPAAALESPRVAMSATDLLRDPAAARAMLQGYPVIVGAAWHVLPGGTGATVDAHETPIGSVVGALLHLNLAEAVLRDRVYPAVPESVVIGIEIALGVAAAVLFALMRSAALATLLLIVAMPVMLALQWLALQLFGVFLDLFAPVLGLGVHAVLDRLIGGGHAHAPATAHSGSTKGEG